MILFSHFLQASKYSDEVLNRDILVSTMFYYTNINQFLLKCQKEVFAEGQVL